MKLWCVGIPNHSTTCGGSEITATVRLDYECAGAQSLAVGVRDRLGHVRIGPIASLVAAVSLLMTFVGRKALALPLSAPHILLPCFLADLYCVGLLLWMTRRLKNRRKQERPTGGLGRKEQLA